MKKKALALLLAIFVLLLSSLLIVIEVKAEENSWITLAPMPTPRRELGVATVNGKIYALGGYNGTHVLNINEEYNPITNTWTTRAPMPTPRFGFAIFDYENKIHVIGGHTATDKITDAHEIYDPLTNTWETKQRSRLKISGFEANIVDDKAYLISGCDHFAPPWHNTDLNYAYDLESETWIAKTPIPTAVFRYASAVGENEIHIIAGYDISKSQGYNLNQIYNPQNDSWKLGSPIPTAINGAGGAITSGENILRRIYVIGGFTSTFSNCTNLTQIYNPKTDTWSTGALMPTKRCLFGLAVVNDELYAIGGTDGINFLGTNQKYTPIGYGNSEPTSSPEPTITPTPTEEPQQTEQDLTTGAVLAVTSIVVFLSLFVYFIKRK
jgi:N-acetylneuraminic acid mutarotase